MFWAGLLLFKVSKRSAFDGVNLWEAVQEESIIMYGFRKHRSQATAQPSIGMTCLLRPARLILSFYDNHFMTKCVYLQRKNRKQI